MSQSVVKKHFALPLLSQYPRRPARHRQRHLIVAALLAFCFSSTLLYSLSLSLSLFTPLACFLGLSLATAIPPLSPSLSLPTRPWLAFSLSLLSSPASP